MPYPRFPRHCGAPHDARHGIPTHPHVPCKVCRLYALCACSLTSPWPCDLPAAFGTRVFTPRAVFRRQLSRFSLSLPLSHTTATRPTPKRPRAKLDDGVGVDLPVGGGRPGRACSMLATGLAPVAGAEPNDSSACASPDGGARTSKRFLSEVSYRHVERKEDEAQGQTNSGAARGEGKRGAGASLSLCPAPATPASPARVHHHHHAHHRLIFLSLSSLPHPIKTLATEVRRLRVAAGAVAAADLAAMTPADKDMVPTPAPGTADPTTGAVGPLAPPTGSPAGAGPAADHHHHPRPFASPSRVFDPFARGSAGHPSSTAGARLGGGGLPTTSQPACSPAGGRRTGRRTGRRRGGAAPGADAAPSSPLSPLMVMSAVPPPNTAASALHSLGALALTSTMSGPACRWLPGCGAGGGGALNQACGAGPPASPSDEVTGGDPAAATGGLDLRRTAMMRALLQRADGCGGVGGSVAAPQPPRAPGAPATRARRFDPAAAGGGGLLTARFAALGGGSAGEAGPAGAVSAAAAAAAPAPRMSWPPRG